MTVYTKQITVVADEPTRVASIDPHPWRALEFDFGIGQVVWVVSHEDSIPYLPAGSSVLSSRMLEPFDYNRACGYLSGSSTYTSPEYEIVDKDNSFSEFLADKNLNLVSSLNKVVREYEWDRNTDLPIWAGTNGHRILSKGTWLFKNHESLGYATKVKVTCADIYRSMDKKIFEPLQWTVGASFGAGDTQIVTTIDVDDFTANPDTYWRPFEHGAHYHHQPSQTGTFIRLESTGSDTVRKEIVWASDMRVSGTNVVIDVVRAQFLTTAQAVTIDSNATAENGKRLNEWIYIDETVTTLFEFLVEGVSGSRTFPAHWTAGAVGFANQYATGFHASEFRLQFSNPKAQTVKKFLESEILIPSVAVSPVNGRGQLTFNPIVLPTDDNAGELVFDESNCKTNRNISLRHVKDDIHTAVEFKYDYDANDDISDDKFQSVAQYNSVDSESFHGFSKTKSYEFQGLHSGLHTNEQLRKLAGAIGDKFYFERLETSIESSINDVALGSLVRVKFNTNIVIDDSTGVVGPLDRTMTVIEARENRARRTTTYQLVGTLQLAQDFYAGQRTHNIEPEEYMRDGIDLAPMIAAGAITLEMGQKYYYYDPLNAGVGVVVGPSVSVTVTGFGPPPQIWCFGFLDWTPDIDLTARSVNQGGMGATTTTEPTQGEYGFFGGQISSGGFTAKRLYTSFTDSSSPGSGSPGTVGDSANQNLVFTASNRFSIEQTGPTFQRVGNTAFPPIVLNANNGQLGGLPFDLSGAGGAGSPLVRLVDRNEDTSGPIDLATLEGSDGGLGGGSLIIVCHGMIMRGRITTNGGDAELPDSLGFSTQSFNGSRGGGGDAGGLLVVVDGAHPRPLFDENNFHAFAGDNQIAGRAPSNYFTINAAVPVGPQTNLAPTNQWESRLKILYTPETAVVQQLVSGGIDAFFQAQRDGSVSIIVADVDPSNANIGDMRITQAELDSNNSDPAFRVLYADGWRDFNRSTDQYLWVYDALIAGKREFNSNEIISSPTRPVGQADGTIWHDSVNNLQWILYETSADILIAANQVPQGEDMIQDISFARSYAGEDLWRLTRDDVLSPVYTGNPAVPLVIPPQTGFTFGRFLETGGESGSAAYQIDASGLGLFNRMMFRDLIPNSGSPSIQTRIRLTSSLVVGNPAFEGLAVRFRGFKLTGTAPATTFTQVWDSDPSSGGERAWYAENSGTFTDAVFIEPIPTNLGIDFLTFEVVVRAASGQVNISNIECRNHYAVEYTLDIGSGLWTSGFSQEIVQTGQAGDSSVERYLRYVRTDSPVIRKGQMITFINNGGITGRAFETQSGVNAQRMDTIVGLMVKLRRTGTTSEDYLTVDSNSVTVDNKTYYSDSSAIFKAEFDYDRSQIVPFVEPLENSAGFNTRDVDRLGVTDMNITMIVSDYISATQ